MTEEGARRKEKEMAHHSVQSCFRYDTLEESEEPVTISHRMTCQEESERRRFLRKLNLLKESEMPVHEINPSRLQRGRRMVNANLPEVSSDEFSRH